MCLLYNPFMTVFSDFIHGSKKVLVITSQPLDPDCISSGIVMKKYLEKLKLDVTLRFPRHLTVEEIQINEYLPLFDELSCEDTRDLINSGSFDTVVLLDGTNWVQFYDNENTLLPPPSLGKVKKVFQIDHHLGDPELLTDNKIKDSSASSTIEIILSKVVPPSFLDEDLATLSYIGIMGDTGNFRWNFNSNTFKLASLLIDSGADPTEAIEKMFFTKSKEYMEVYKYTLDSIEYDDELRTIFMFLPKSTMDKDNLDERKCKVIKDVFINEIAKGVAEYHRGVFVSEVGDKGTVKVSARGSTLYNTINLPDLWKSLGGNGGGHFNASGMEIKGDFLEIKELIKDGIRKTLSSQLSE